MTATNEVTATASTTFIQPAKAIAGLNVYDTLPEGARVRRLAGDFLNGGTIDDANRPSRLEILVTNGVGYHVDHGGYVEGAIVIDVDGAIEIGGGSWTFLPDAGEMARVGLAKAAEPVPTPGVE